MKILKTYSIIELFDNVHGLTENVKVKKTEACLLDSGVNLYLLSLNALKTGGENKCFYLGNAQGLFPFYSRIKYWEEINH